MSLNAKSLGTVKKLQLDKDLEFENYIFDLDGSEAFTSQSQSFISYNKYIACINGWLLMKESIIRSGDAIVKLPFKPKFSMPKIIGTVTNKSDCYVLYIDSEGIVRPHTDMDFTAFGSDRYLNMVGSFPIEIE